MTKILSLDACEPLTAPRAMSAIEEVTQILIAHPVIHTVRVVASDDDRLTAYVEAVDPAETSIGELDQFLSERLPPSSVPRVVLTHDVNLDGTTGIGSSPDGCDDSVAELLRVAWREVLRVTAVHDDDDFFDLGGDSLKGARVLARLERDCGVSLPLRAVFEGPTIRSLAALVQEFQRNLGNRG